jgi:hypothetical protein
MQWKTSLLEWWWLISEKRCDGCTHSQEDDYNEDLKAFSTISMNSKTLYIQNLTLGDEAPKVMWAPLG